MEPERERRYAGLGNRLAIALQICSAAQKLQVYSKPPIYHGNITSDDIILDEFCNAKLAGFGCKLLLQRQQQAKSCANIRNGVLAYY